VKVPGRETRMAKTLPQKLQDQIDAKRAEIHADQYSISVGEIANMYRDGDVDIHPEFQRFYRWSDEQKSRFIESILLGIPIPSLFVAQREDGKWDVIDGLQRLSTILQLMGILRGQEGESQRPLVLTRTKYLPSLEGMAWDSGQPDDSLTEAQRLYVKRAKLDFKIILRQSGESAKFELFQRLNTGGAELSDQEIRNAMLVAANRDFFGWIKKLSTLSDFERCVYLSERSYQEQFDLELVLRFLILRRIPRADLRGMGDLGEFLTDRMLMLAKEFDSFKVAEERAFKQTFGLVASAAAEDSFRKFDADQNAFTRGFSISAFEVVALGIGYNIQKLSAGTLEITEIVKSLWSNREFTESSGSGVRASTRIPHTIALGRKLFKP
jgi:hypothetical protein